VICVFGNVSIDSKATTKNKLTTAFAPVATITNCVKIVENNIVQREIVNRNLE